MLPLIIDFVLWDFSTMIPLVFGGNYEYQDQVFALEWIYNNIAAFGGNSDRVISDSESVKALSLVFI